MFIESLLRDPADKIGATLGFIIGVTLVALVLVKHELLTFSLNGLNIPQSTFTECVLYLLMVGICVNLFRNLAVGLHDTILFFYAVYKRNGKK